MVMISLRASRLLLSLWIVLSVTRCRLISASNSFMKSSISTSGCVEIIIVPSFSVCKLGWMARKHFPARFDWYTPLRDERVVVVNACVGNFVDAHEGGRGKERQNRHDYLFKLHGYIVEGCRFGRGKTLPYGCGWYNAAFTKGYRKDGKFRFVKPVQGAKYCKNRILSRC